MSDGPAILLLHGFTGSGASWQPVVSSLPERYSPITPDIRGHASASDLRPVALGDVLGDMHLALEAAGVGKEEPFVLGGYSQGARIAVHAALHFRRRVERLVLVGGSPGLADNKERMARQAADNELADEFEQLTIEEIADRWEKTPILQGITAARAASARAERLRSTPAGLAAALRGLGTGALGSKWESLREITCPVALIAGQRDVKFQEIDRQMSAKLAQSRTLVAEGAGHAVHLERPDVVADALTAPWDSIPVQ